MISLHEAVGSILSQPAPETLVALQGALLDLFRHSDGFEVDDNGIEHRTHGEEFLRADVVRALMDRMVDAAEMIRPVLCT